MDFIPPNSIFQFGHKVVKHTDHFTDQFLLTDILQQYCFIPRCLCALTNTDIFILFFLQRLGSDNAAVKPEEAPTKSASPKDPKNSGKNASETVAEVRVLKETETKDKKSTKESKPDKANNDSTRNTNETKSDTKADKSMKTGEWDMFADQDNFDSVDVSKVNVQFLIIYNL